MTREVRRLPFVIAPIPDEPLDSWVETMAHAYDVSLGEMLIALGLRDVNDYSMTRWTVASRSVRLTDAQARNLELATGMPAEGFHQMTRVRFWETGIRTGLTGIPSTSSPATGNGGRYCPECLSDSGGRWRMSWQLTTGFACPRHSRLLVDTCPQCGQPPRSSGHPLTLIPRPGTCFNREPGEATAHTRCRGDLTMDRRKIVATDTVLAAQRTVFRMLASGTASFGIFAALPQPSIAVLKDLLYIARLCRVAALAHTIPSDGTVDDILLAEFHAGSADADASRGLPKQAKNIAVGVALAFHTLSDRERTLTLLRDRVPPSTSYADHTPQMQELIATALGRRRRPTALLNSAAMPTDGDPEVRARRLPIMLWDDWARRLAPRRIDREIAATALSAAVVFAGTRVTHAAALRLLDPEGPSRIVTGVMRQLGATTCEDSSLAAIRRLANYLDESPPPIDYGRRRRIDFTELLPTEQWVEICAAANVPPGGFRRYSIARHFLFNQLTGSPIRNAPNAWQHGRPVRYGDLREMRFAAPATVLNALDAAGAHFLANLEIHEPTRWMPPIDLLSDLEFTKGPPRRSVLKWPVARPARARATDGLPQLSEAYQSGATTRELAEQAGVSRQTVSRALNDSGTAIRPGKQARYDLDADWLYDKRFREDLTVAQIAELVGCSANTIRNKLHHFRLI